jgi:hypothetical protein
MRTRDIGTYPRFAEEKNKEQLQALRSMGINGIPDLVSGVLMFDQFRGSITHGTFEGYVRNYLNEKASPFMKETVEQGISLLKLNNPVLRRPKGPNGGPALSGRPLTSRHG